MNVGVAVTLDVQVLCCVVFRPNQVTGTTTTHGSNAHTHTHTHAHA